MQDALFQSRIATGNLLKLQKELENFLEVDYLKELKIQPTDQDEKEFRDVIETEMDMDNDDENADRSIEDLDQCTSELTSGSLLADALSGGAFLI